MKVVPSKFIATACRDCAKPRLKSNVQSVIEFGQTLTLPYCFLPMGLAHRSQHQLALQELLNVESNRSLSLVQATEGTAKDRATVVAGLDVKSAAARRAINKVHHLILLNILYSSVCVCVCVYSNLVYRSSRNNLIRNNKAPLFPPRK